MKKLVLVAVLAVLVLGGVSLLMDQSEQTSFYKMDYVSDLATIKVGSQAVIPDWEWVEVVNESPITQRFSNVNSQLIAGETCGVEFGGTIIVKEVRGDNLLVEYTSPGNPAGTPCPSGVQYIVSKSDLASMSDQYASIRDSIQAEKELVKQLLAQNYYGETMDAGDWRWVDVVNLDPVIQNFANGEVFLVYGETCGIGRFDLSDDYASEGGTIQVRGVANGRVLYQYTTHDNPIGTPCPSGILFFGEESR